MKWSERKTKTQIQCTMNKILDFKEMFHNRNKKKSLCNILDFEYFVSFQSLFLKNAITNKITPDMMIEIPK